VWVVVGGWEAGRGAATCRLVTSQWECGLEPINDAASAVLQWHQSQKERKAGDPTDSLQLGSLRCCPPLGVSSLQSPSAAPQRLTPWALADVRPFVAWELRSFVRRLGTSFVRSSVRGGAEDIL
jgi:hypothetical protein